MGEIVQTLIVLAIIIVTVVKMMTGDSEKKKKQQSGANLPRRDREVKEMEYKRPSPTPFLSYEYDLYHAPPETPQPPTPKKRAKKTETPPPTQGKSDENQEFNIQSAEEVRRGIIWSEILSRKY